MEQRGSGCGCEVGSLVAPCLKDPKPEVRVAALEAAAALRLSCSAYLGHLPALLEDEEDVRNAVVSESARAHSYFSS